MENKSIHTNETMEENNAKVAAQYVPGRYRATKTLRVMKKISYANKNNSDGSVARTYATWTSPNNFYYFSPSVSVDLSKEDLEHSTIQQLIDNGTIFRVIN